jgi:hypothetical protein
VKCFEYCCKFESISHSLLASIGVSLLFFMRGAGEIVSEVMLVWFISAV